MPNSSIYEMYGRLAEERDLEHQRHLATIALLRSIKSGEIPLEAVEVYDDDSWKVIVEKLPKKESSH